MPIDRDPETKYPHQSGFVIGMVMIYFMTLGLMHYYGAVGLCVICGSVAMAYVLCKWIEYNSKRETYER